MKKFKVLILLSILLLATVLRLWKLDKYPAGLNADEAAIGYNAYSLLLTGKDEHGASWPIHFKSFGDYKPGLYFYIVLPFVKVLGLNIWAVRLPSAILGILSVLVIYLLVEELFEKKKLFAVHYSLCAAFLLAISPWHLHFSRGGWETNAATSFILFGTYFFLKSLRNFRYYILHITFYIFSMYAYHSTRVIAPFLALGLALIYRKQVFKKENLKRFLLYGVLGLIVLLPLIKDFLGQAGAARFSGVGFLADRGPFWRVNELRGQHADFSSLPARLLHNKVIAYGLVFAKNYTDHFRGDFLFVSGDEIQRNKIPDFGLMYYFDILLLPTGLFFLLRGKEKYYLAVLLWLLIAPIAAAMTFQSPHALRALNMIIPLTIISAYGVYGLIEAVQKFLSKKFLITGYLLLITLVVWCFSNYLHQYYVHYPKTYPVAWEYGFKETVEHIKGIESKYDKIYVTDKYDQPYILFLFFLKYPPQQFQKEVKLTPRDEFGFSTVRDFGKFHFASIDWNKLKEAKNVLLVGTDDEIPDAANVIKTINFPNGKPGFQIAEL